MTREQFKQAFSDARRDRKFFDDEFLGFSEVLDFNGVHSSVIESLSQGFDRLASTYRHCGQWGRAPRIIHGPVGVLP